MVLVNINNDLHQGNFHRTSSSHFLGRIHVVYSKFVRDTRSRYSSSAALSLSTYVTEGVDRPDTKNAEATRRGTHSTQSPFVDLRSVCAMPEYGSVSLLPSSFFVSILCISFTGITESLPTTTSNECAFWGCVEVSCSRSHARLRHVGLTHSSNKWLPITGFQRGSALVWHSHSLIFFKKSQLQRVKRKISARVCGVKKVQNEHRF